MRGIHRLGVMQMLTILAFGDRLSKLQSMQTIALSFGLICLGQACHSPERDKPRRPPNILFVISDDQSYPHASAYGSGMVKTVYFDAVAADGVLFRNAFCAAPQCSPNRAAILTGKNIWQLEEAGTHASYFPHKFSVFTDALENGGYQLGYTGKAWGPGNWQDAGWKRNPVGPAFNDVKFADVPTTGMSSIDYAGNFKVFLEQRTDGHPFFFWYGAQEPHRNYEEGSGMRSGKELTTAEVPPFLPDVPVVREDLLDYALEIEWFDHQLGKMIDLLKASGELANTVIIITADNGMAFPYAKANLQEYGIHVPLVVSGPGIQKGKVSDELISQIDLAPTILALAGLPALESISGRSFLPLLEGNGAVVAHRDWVAAGRERHTHARPDNLGYPARAIRTDSFLYIQNLNPDLWPAGDPQIQDNLKLPDGSTGYQMLPAYFDIDASPTKTYMLEQQDEFPLLFNLAFGKRPAEELFDLLSDPGCLSNLADEVNFQEIKNRLQQTLLHLLTEENDPRLTGAGSIFDSYPRMSPMRNFQGFKEQGAYNPTFRKSQ